MRKIAMLVLLGLAACGPGRGSYATGAVSPLALQPPPIYSLFGFREALGLTSEQVESLDSIARDVKSRNDPVVDSLSAIADRRSGRMHGVIPLDDTTRPLLERVGENNRSAALAVQETLTEAQREAVCRRAEDPRRARDREQEPRQRRPAIAPEDSALFTPLVGGWPWCAEPPATG